MKKISLTLLSLVLCTLSIFAQEAVLTWDGIKSDIKKSDENINNPKKNTKTRIWMERAEIFLSAAQFNSIGLYQGLQSSSTEVLLGTPTSIEKEGNQEKWIYDSRNLFFENGELKRWEETKKIDEDAYGKAADAVFGAEKTDPSGKFKTNEYYQPLISKIRDGIVNAGVAYNEAGNFEKSFEYIRKGVKLADFPRNSADTLFKVGTYELYAGMIGTKAKKYSEAEEVLNSCIKRGTEAGTPYHYLSLLYLEKGDTITSLKKIEEGFDKFPETEQLIIDLVNYYNTKGETDKVIEYINIAIEKNPGNPSYYSANAVIYNQRVEDANKDIYKYLEAAHNYKKEAFKVRNNQAESSKFEKMKDDAIKTASEVEEKATANFTKAVELYNKSLEKNPQFFNAIFNLGLIYYNRAEKYDFYATKAFEMSKDEVKEAEYKKLYNADMLKSIDYFEKVLKLNPNEKNSMKMLKKMYYKLKNTEKYEYYKNLLGE